MSADNAYPAPVLPLLSSIDQVGAEGYTVLRTRLGPLADQALLEAVVIRLCFLALTARWIENVVAGLAFAALSAILTAARNFPVLVHYTRVLVIKQRPVLVTQRSPLRTQSVERLRALQGFQAIRIDVAQRVIFDIYVLSLSLARAVISRVD